jgi:acetyl esterase
VFGSVDTFDEATRLICDECEVVVVSVEYPLAPEHRFPTALNSGVASVAWVKENIASVGGDPDAVVVMGDSAGGNLAAATALACADRDIELTGQAILYGTLVHPDHAGAVGLAWAERDQRFGPTLDATEWYWGNYVDSPEMARHPRASVLLEADLRKAPPAVIAAGMLDTYCAECRTYGHRLLESGVKAVVSEYPRLTNGFITHGWWPEGHRSQLAFDATMDTLGKVKDLAYS